MTENRVGLKPIPDYSLRKGERKMKVLFIGGTGTISTAISKKVIELGWDLYLINRGSRNDVLGDKVHWIKADVGNEADVAAKLEGMTFDTVCDFIGFVPEQIERDYRLFKGKTSQYMYISSASAYNKPCRDYRITEGTTLANPYWEYSRNKIACEELLMKWYREEGFPVTIIRPSHTYDERNVPMGVEGNNGSYQVLKRMLEGKPVIVHGDGTSLWTMTHNSDFAKGFIGLMGNKHAIGEAYQITNDESYTWNQIYETIADILGVEYKPYYVSSEFLDAVAPYDYRGGLIGDKSNTVVFDNSKLKAAVPGLCMNVSLREGFTQTINYVMSHPECQRLDPEFDAWCDKVIDTLEKAKKEILQNK